MPGASAQASTDLSAIEPAIERTLPTDPGQRHRKGNTGLAGADPSTLESIVREWHGRALPFITTKEFKFTFSDFIDGWGESSDSSELRNLGESL